MSWYYAAEGRQVGPVSDAELQARIAAGVVRSDTLVWREGMTGWRPYGELAGGAAGSQPICSQCGRAFPADELIGFGDRLVCAACKPGFVQALREGAVATQQFAYGGFWIRLGAWLIDVLILGAIRFILYFPILLKMFSAPGESASLAMVGVQMMVNMIDFAIRVGYQTFFVGRYAATPGKMACGLKVVMPDGGRVGYPRALARFFAKIISYLTLMVGFVMAAFDDEKRALHDRICDTRVVKG